MDPTNNELPTPVNPVITPTNNANVSSQPMSGAATNEPAGAAEPVIPPAPVPPVFNPATMATPDVSGMNLSATDPITMPEPVKEPDPVEQELNAPFKAAEPVPGSIGSAISVPAVEQQENVEMQDAAQPNMMQQNMMQPGQVVAKPKKKMNKTTLTLLCVLAGITIVALVAVLIIELNR